MNEPAKELGRRLRAGRSAKGWTLRQAASEIGISNGYLSLIEQGEVKAPSPRFLMALANQYGLSYDELMALAGHPSGPVATTAAAPIKAGTDRTGSAHAQLSGARDLGAHGWAGAGLTGVFGAGRAGVSGDALDLVRGDGERGADDTSVVASTGAGHPRHESTTEGDEITDEERQQLLALVIDDMRGFSASDIANVRAFIAGIRATRRR